MISHGRNDPCPCGSGRKFKRCCGARDGAAPAAPAAFSRADRRRAFDRLVGFATGDEFAVDFAVAHTVFWSSLQNEPMDGMDRDVREHATACFLTWVAVDVELEVGKTLLDLYLERRGGDLPPGESAFLQRLRDTHVGPYEVLEVRRDEGMRLRDLWSGAEVWVRERRATHQIVRWDLLGARLIEGPDGVVEFEEIPYLLPSDAKEPLLRDLREALKVFGRGRAAGGGDAAFFKRALPVFHQYWIERVIQRPPLQVATVEGDPLVLTKVVFDVRDAAGVKTALATCPEFEVQEDGSFTWMEGGGSPRRILGTVMVRGARLALEAISEKRGVRGRKMLERLLGDRVRYRATRAEDAMEAARRKPAPKRRPSSVVPPEIEAEVLREFYDQHYRAWPDVPLPALGNRTPRHAARLKSVRPKLMAILKHIENTSERQRLQGGYAYDVGWLWKDLGLERE